MNYEGHGTVYSILVVLEAVVTGAMLNSNNDGSNDGHSHHFNMNGARAMVTAISN